jgi:hypothetical protein
MAGAAIRLYFGGYHAGTFNSGAVITRLIRLVAIALKGKRTGQTWRGRRSFPQVANVVRSVSRSTGRLS